jgi:hypothetical protein
MKLWLVAAVLIGISSAQAQDLHSIAPPAILQMDSLPNAGELYLRFCLVGNHICTEHGTSCHGQCCDQSMADSEGYGCSGDVFGVRIPGSHYAGWRCHMYSEPVGAVPVEGPAGPTPEHIKECHNLR